MGRLYKFAIINAMPEDEKRALLPSVTDQDEVINRVLQQLQEEGRGRGSVYGLLTQVQKDIVDRLVETNYAFYQTQFNSDYRRFREAMATNWLAKFRAFPELVSRGGFGPLVVTGNQSQDEKAVNQSMVAALTTNSSYVLVSPGSMDRQGEGASLVYQRIPLREGEELRDIVRDGGVILAAVPKVGERLSAVRTVSTSELLMVYTKTMAGQRNPVVERQERDDLSGTINQTFHGIDRKTIRFK